MRKIVFIIIACLLATNNIFSNYKLGPISYTRLIEFMIFFAFFNSFIKEFSENSYFRKYFLFVITFTVLQLFVNIKLVAFDGYETKMILEGFVKSISFGVFSFLFYLLIKSNIKYLNIILIIHFIICLFALLQHPFSPLSSEVHELKKLLFIGTETTGELFERLQNEEAYIRESIYDRFRLSGPFRSTIGFAYFLFVSFALNIYMLIRTSKNIYLIPIGIIIVCSILTQTRSLFLAEVIVIIGIVLFISTRKINSLKTIGIFISLIVASMLFFNYSSRLDAVSQSRLENFSDTGSNRPLLWLTGIYAVANHPFGVSVVEYNQIKMEMFKKTGVPSVKNYSSHNGLINIGIHYTIFGYLVIFIFIWFIVNNSKKLERPFSLLFIIFMMGYLINTSFHNRFAFYNDYDILMIVLLINIHFQFQIDRNKITNELDNFQ